MTRNLHLVPSTGADRLKANYAEQASASAEMVHDLIVSYRECIRLADIVAGLTHVPVGQREHARETACRLRERVATLEQMIARA